jgi:NAD(P)-dependent dehydrogenase (short-subunit alcohol dehydrogenase family)
MLAELEHARFSHGQIVSTRRVKMTDKLEGRVAVVTGAGSGIGTGIAEALHREGARVVAVDISGGQEDVAKRLGDRCLAVHADVTKADDVRSMLDAATSTFGRLDVLCNNAGIDGDLGPIGECSEENYDRVMAVNAKGVFLGMHHAIPIMLAGGGGSIINTASVSAVVATPQLGVYGGAKAAVVMMTKIAAAEYAGSGLRINCICPGPVETGMLRSLAPEFRAAMIEQTPMGRIAQPIELGNVVAFLASDDASFVTGTALPVDGGWVA